MIDKVQDLSEANGHDVATAKGADLLTEVYGRPISGSVSASNTELLKKAENSATGSDGFELFDPQLQIEEPAEVKDDQPEPQMAGAQGEGQIQPSENRSEEHQPEENKQAENTQEEKPQEEHQQDDRTESLLSSRFGGLYRITNSIANAELPSLSDFNDAFFVPNVVYDEAKSVLSGIGDTFSDIF